MGQSSGYDGVGELAGNGGPAPSESASHSEHQAALEATIFRSGRDGYELVLELEAGELRLRRPHSG